MAVFKKIAGFLFAAMDGMIGKDYETGLANLKAMFKETQDSYRTRPSS